MPNPNSVVMRVSGSVEPRISSINQARLKGFTEFYFCRTLEDAQRASYEHCVCDTKLRTVVFDEVVEYEGQEFTLHVLGMTPRPKPVGHYKSWLGRLTPEQRIRRKALTAVGILEDLADECGMTEGARLLMHASWHLENPTPRHNAKLDAFAVFMGEWAAKLKKVASR